MSCCASRVEVGSARRVPVNNAIDRAAPSPFPNNTITNTKYTVLTFLPKNLAEQFSKFMNVYFFFIGVLQLFPALTPVNPLTTWIPLFVIFTVSAVKEAIDDYFRAVSDRTANTKAVSVVRQGRLVTLHSANIEVGDIIRVKCDEEFPADAVILHSTTEEGTAYIETANLDGETDHKSRQSLPCTQRLTIADIFAMRAVIECAVPNAMIYEFDSNMTFNGETHSLNQMQLMLQGTFLRNTEEVLCAVVYTGNQTKMGCNKRDPPAKHTRLDQFINRMTAVIFAFQICLTLVLGIVGYDWQTRLGQRMSYLDFGPPAQSSKETFTSGLIVGARFLLLMSYMIPISLKVTLDMVKLYYALLINWDDELVCPKTGKHALAKNTAISEDLGQIEYIFTDKTGTITENVMRFAKSSLNGVVYEDGPTDAHLLRVLRKNIPISPGHVVRRGTDEWRVAHFFRCLALNHNVVPVSSPSDSGSGTAPSASSVPSRLMYKASSPDEEALVNAAQDAGVTFLARQGTALKLDFLLTVENYELLSTLKFTSERRRMGVIVRALPSNTITLYMKGADEKMLPRLRSDQDMSMASIHLEQFACSGLRTLIMAKRDMSEEEYADYARQEHEASVSLENRDDKLASVFSLFEKDLEFLGITAIEDKLQEGVPETIASLREAGIRFVMLTGDKFATAVQIAAACHLTSPAPHGTLLKIDGTDSLQIESCLSELTVRSRDLVAGGRSVSVIVEGGVLQRVLSNQGMRAQLRSLMKLCHSVICCRVSPTQKAQVVKVMKEDGALTLAIGDGGNDVSMIQEAHIGVGLSGREGLQAARASDYAVARFRFLQRLCLVHGRYGYQRTAVIAQYCFFKSIFLALCQIAFNIMAGFSGVSLFNSYSLVTYNVFFTGLPAFGFALGRDVEMKSLMKSPSLYKASLEGQAFTYGTAARWFLRALALASVVMAASFGGYGSSYINPNNGSASDYSSVGMVAFTCIILLNMVVIALEVVSVTVLNHVLVWGTLAMYFGGSAAYTSLKSQSFYYVMFGLYADLTYWMVGLLALGSGLAILLTEKYITAAYYPTPSMTQRIYDVVSARGGPTFKRCYDELSEPESENSRLLNQNL